MAKVVINDLVDKALEDITTCYENFSSDIDGAVIKHLEVEIRSNDLNIEDYGWIFDLDSITSIKLYGKEDKLIKDYTNYSKLKRLANNFNAMENENEFYDNNFSRLIFQFIN